MDPRVVQAQQLFWEIEALRRQQPGQPPVAKLTQMAQLHQARALELLQKGDADGWTDLYAAVTAWGEAGARTEAEHLLSVGRQLAAGRAQGRANVEGQLNELEQWLNGLAVKNGANGSAAPGATSGKATLARLGERIEECLTLARHADADGLERVIDLLSQAHDEVAVRVAG